MRAPCGYRDDVQGLRGVAVLAVVLFHAGVPGLGGGFAGVDAFYVLSGYVVTGVLLRGRPRLSVAALGYFWGRRARRLLPAATVVLVATVVGSALLLPALQARGAMVDAGWSAVFAANLHFAQQQTDYLGAHEASPFQHWWSLGVEEQFYLLWPLLVLALARRRRLLVVVLGGVAALSFIAGVLVTRLDQPLAFFLLPFRAWELAAGALVLLAPRVPTPWRGLLGWCGLVLLVVGFTGLGSRTPYPGVAALLPVLGTAAVLLNGERHGVAAPLSARPLRALGEVSYTWYLWHWPFLVLLSTSGFAARSAAVAGSLLAAGLTTKGLESPLRHAPRLAMPRRALGLGMSLVLLSGTSVLVVDRLLPSMTGRGAAATLPALEVQPARAVGARAARQDDGLGRLQPLLEAALRPAPVPRNLQPTLDRAHADKAVVFVDGCNLRYLDTTPLRCRFGDGQSPQRVVLWGDSHAAQWEPALDDLGRQHHWELESLTKATCPPFLLPIRSPVLGRQFRECDAFNGSVVARLRAERVQTVVLGVARHYSAPRRVSPDYGFAVYGSAWQTALHDRVAQLRGWGIRVVVLGPTPKPRDDEPICLSRHLDDASRCAYLRSAEVDAAGAAAERAAVTSAGGTWLPVADWLCTATRCPAVIGNDLVQRDDNHLTTHVVRWLEPLLALHLP